MVALALLVLAVDSGVEARLAEARRLLESDPAAALAELDQVARAAAADPLLLARAYLLTGAAHAMAGRAERAADSYRTALELDETTRPTGLPARAIAAWDFAGLPAVKPEVTPAPEPPRPAPEPVVQAEAPKPSRTRWASWLTGAAAVAAGGGGLALGLWSRSHAEAANRLPDLVAGQQSYAGAGRESLAANVLFGVAGALAIAFVVSLLLGL